MSISLGIPSLSLSFDTAIGITDVVSFSPQANAGVDTIILYWYPFIVNGAPCMVKVSVSTPLYGANGGSLIQTFPESLLSYHSYTALPITSTVVPRTMVSFSSTLSVTGSVSITAAEPTSL